MYTSRIELLECTLLHVHQVSRAITELPGNIRLFCGAGRFGQTSVFTSGFGNAFNCLTQPGLFFGTNFGSYNAKYKCTPKRLR